MKEPALLWDIPTRITHWALALCVTLNLFVLEQGDDPHQWVGYGAVGLVAFRFGWGFWGGRSSRFSSFPIHPKTVIAYIRSGMKEEKSTAFKHNPLAAYVYIFLWLCVLGLGISGWMLNLEKYWGEEWLEEIHSNLSTAVEILVIVHLLGMTFDAFRYRRYTWLAMITGRRDKPIRWLKKKD